MDEEKFIDPRYLEELRKYSASGHKDNDDAMALTMAGQAVFHPDHPFVSIESRSHVNTMPEMPHDDAQDAAAIAIPPMAGIIGAAAAILNPKLKDANVEIPRKPDVFRPTKAMLDILSEQIDSDLNKRLTEFGETNGFPVVFVFYQTLKDEDGVSKATCDIKMYKPGEKQDARLFALQHAGEFGIFDPRSKDEQIKDLEKKVKRLEEDRDYWKREAEGDDGDTLGLFRHWDD